MITLIKLLVSIMLFGIAFRLVDGKEMAQLVSNANFSYIALAILFQVASTSIASYRWSLIMKALNFHLPFSYYLSHYFKGSFFNQALPGSIGGDALRGIDLGKLGYSKKEAFAGIFIDRIVGLSGLLVLNLIANLFSENILPFWLYHLINMICIIGISGFIILSLLHIIPILSRYRITRIFSSLSLRFRKVYADQQSIVVQIGLSVLIHFLSILSIFEIARSLGLSLPLTTFLVVVPPVFLLTILPISLAGWGIRETAMVGIFMLIGAPKEEILSISIMYGVMLIIASLPGLIVWYRGKNFI